MKVKELTKLKTLRKISEQELKTHFSKLTGVDFCRAMNKILQSDIFTIKADFLKEVGRTVHEDVDFTFYDNYETYRKQNKQIVTLKSNPKIAYAVVYSGKLIKSEMIYFTHKVRYQSDENYGYPWYTTISDIKFIKNI